MSGYTPTTEDVEFCFVGEYDPEMRSRAFHRWLAAHDREVRAQALREAASAPIPRAGLRQWLRARADRIERGE